MSPLAPLARRLLERLLARAERGPSRPWRPLERRSQAAFDRALPEAPGEPEALLELLSQHRLLDPPGHAHPAFMGWAVGSGSLEGAMGAMVDAFTQTNAFGGAQVSTVVEAQVRRWTLELLALPPERWRAVMTEGASMANLLGLAAARSRAYPDLDAGLFGQPAGRLFTSAAAHHSVTRASRVLGLGAPAVVDAPGDTLDPEALDAALDAARAAGVRPVAVVATSGTAASAAFDPLEAVAAVCERRGVWLHVDGAFGAWARLAPARAERVRGLERADSVAVDHHKALHAPYGVGALLIRDEAALAEAMRAPSDYLRPTRGGYGGLEDWPSQLALTTSRRFGALGLFTRLELAGAAQLRAEVEASYALAEALAERIRTTPSLRLLGAPSGPAVLFRGPGDGRAHARALTRLTQDGRALLTQLERPDGPALRASTLGRRLSLSALADMVTDVHDALTR